MRIAKYLCILLGAALLSSCSIGLTVRVTNESPQMIAVSYQRLEKSVITVIEPGKKAEFGGATTFTILRDGKAHLYQFDGAQFDGARYDMQTDEGFGPFVQRLLKFVYAQDGCIYIVPRGHEPALKLGDAQPQGFPLCPKTMDVGGNL